MEGDFLADWLKLILFLTLQKVQKSFFFDEMKLKTKSYKLLSLK